MTIGERIKQARKAKGIKRKELAEKIGTTPQTICRYEADGRRPKVDAMLKIAEVLGVPVSDLLGEPRPATPTDHTEARLNQLMEECG